MTPATHSTTLAQHCCNISTIMDLQGQNNSDAVKYHRYYTCKMASTTVMVLPVPGGPNSRYGVGRHWPLTTRQTAALWRSFRDELYRKSSAGSLIEDLALLSFEDAPYKREKEKTKQKAIVKWTIFLSWFYKVNKIHKNTKLTAKIVWNCKTVLEKLHKLDRVNDF